jgi:hypothetical protein
MEVIWKPVLGYETFYAASSDGRVMRLAGVFCRSPRILKPMRDHGGYARVKLSVPGHKPVTRSVHKLVCEAFIGPSPKDFTVNHLDLNKSNNSADNLEFCTRQENTAHAVANGRISLSNAVLSRDDVQLIRAEYKPRDGSSARLAARFGITKRSICRLIDGTNWHHVKP